MRKGQHMSMRDAMALVPDDMPDGAFWALAHEYAGLDYGDGFAELAHEDRKPKTIACKHCKKRFAETRHMEQHVRDKHAVQP